VVIIFFFGGPGVKLIDVADVSHCWWAVVFEVRGSGSPVSFESGDLTGAFAAAANVSKQTALSTLSQHDRCSSRGEGVWLGLVHLLSNVQGVPLCNLCIV
jgi:hypothetical protein